MQNRTSDQTGTLSGRVLSLLQNTSVNEIEETLWDMFNRTVESEDATPEEIKDAAFYCRQLTKFFQSMEVLNVMH